MIKPAATFLQTENRDLQSILAKVKLLNELNTAVANYLDDNLKNYCQVANLINNQLILIAANGSIATQIRFQSADLIRKFKNHPALKTIQTIHCKVRPASSAAPLNPSHEKMTPLSQTTAELIRDTAQGIDDPAIREALERIAKHIK